MPAAYRALLTKYGRAKMQKHIEIILAQKEMRPGSFDRSEIAAFVDRVQHDYAPPDWFQDLARAQDLTGFQEIKPTDATEVLYQAITR